MAKKSNPYSISSNTIRRIKMRQLATPMVGGIRAKPDMPTVFTLKAADHMIRNRVMAPGLHGLSIEEICEHVLLGLTISPRYDMGSDYSLLNLENENLRLLENKNIIDPRLTALKNSPQDPTVDKFPNDKDPFYELDEAKPQFKENQLAVLKQLEKKNLTAIISGIYGLNAPQAKGLKIKQLN